MAHGLQIRSNGQCPENTSLYNYPFLPEDTYFYTLRIWSCNSHYYTVNNSLQYIVANNFYFDVPEILNYDLKNCCDDFEVYNNIVFPNTFRKDVNDFIIAGDLGPATVQAGSNVKFFAGNDILLGPNFIAQLGSNFTAEIQDCVYGHKSVTQGRQRPSEIYPLKPEAVIQDVRIKNSISSSGQVEFYTIGDIDISNYTVLDLQGNILSSNSLNSDKGIIDMSLLSNGMYIINFETNDAQVYTKKIVLSK